MSGTQAESACRYHRLKRYSPRASQLAQIAKDCAATAVARRERLSADYIAGAGMLSGISCGQNAGRVGTGKNRPGGSGGGPVMQQAGVQKLNTPPTQWPAARIGEHA
jgi:hypothetical protein